MMNKTHGNTLYSESTSNGPTINDLLYRQKPEETTGGLSSSETYNDYNPPRGEVGWICPICGRGLSPSTAYCNCNMTKPDIVYSNGGLTMKSILDDAILCQCSDSTTLTSSNSNDKGSVYGAHYDMHN